MFKQTGKVVALLAGIAITPALVAQQSSFGQTAEYTENVPMTYTIAAWRSRSHGNDELGRVSYTKLGAVRSDGSTVTETVTVSEDGHTRTLRGIMDLEAGVYRTVDPSLKSTTTTTLRPERIANARNSRSECSGEADSSVLGYDVVRQVTNNASLFEHGELRVELLIAPELGCLVMDRTGVLVYDHDGSERIIRNESVVDVQLGERSAGLFNVPDDYVEMSPRDRMLALKRATAAELSNDEIVRRAERRYQEHGVR